MPPQVTTSAMMMCTFGVAPAALIVPPTGITAGELPAATIMNFTPIANIPTFGMCITPSNPAVASATAAALGVLTPMPCIPATASPWIPGATMVTIQGQPALHQACTCMCSYGGVISITSPGQMIVDVT